MLLGSTTALHYLSQTKTSIVSPSPNVSTGTPTVPTLIGWGGIRMDEASLDGVNPPTNPPPSNVFPGEPATTMELVVLQMKAMGYNTVRVDFDPYCTDMVDYNYMSVYSLTNAQRAVEIAQHYGFWIVLDYHGYTDIFGNTDCWLNYWKPIVQSVGSLYSNIVWEPENEPEYFTCINSPSSCPTPPCSDDTSCVAYLGSAYQQWIDQARSLGDTHWIVAQNLCSYSCGFDDFSLGYPTVTDPLGSFSQGGRIFISLHSYLDYNATSTSWTNATAEVVANQFYRAVLAGVANTGWPALNTEGGTDPLSCDPNICAPDTLLDGSAGYTVVTFHFIQTLVNLYDSNSPQRINWIFWPAGAWTNTPGAGIYGALQCDSVPIGWGCLLSTTTVDSIPSFAISTDNPIVSLMPTFSQNVNIAVTSIGGFTGSIDLTATVNGTGVSVNLSGQIASLPSGGVASLTLAVSTTNTTDTGHYTITITAVGSGLSQTLTVPVNVDPLGDLDGDGVVSIEDISMVLSHYGSTEASANWNPSIDFNHDGMVNLLDFEMAVHNYGVTIGA